MEILDDMRVSKLSAKVFFFKSELLLLTLLAALVSCYYFRIKGFSYVEETYCWKVMRLKVPYLGTVL